MSLVKNDMYLFWPLNVYWYAETAGQLSLFPINYVLFYKQTTEEWAFLIRVGSD